MILNKINEIILFEINNMLLDLEINLDIVPFQCKLMVFIRQKLHNLCSMITSQSKQCFF